MESTLGFRDAVNNVDVLVDDNDVGDLVGDLNDDLDGDMIHVSDDLDYKVNDEDVFDSKVENMNILSIEADSNNKTMYSVFKTKRSNIFLLLLKKVINLKNSIIR